MIGITTTPGGVGLSGSSMFDVSGCSSALGSIFLFNTTEWNIGMSIYNIAHIDAKLCRQTLSVSTHEAGHDSYLTLH